HVHSDRDGDRHHEPGRAVAAGEDRPSTRHLSLHLHDPRERRHEGHPDGHLGPVARRAPASVAREAQAQSGFTSMKSQFAANGGAAPWEDAERPTASATELPLLRTNHLDGTATACPTYVRAVVWPPVVTV